MKTALRMNDPHFAMSIYEEAGDVYFKGHRNQMASLPFYRVPVINYYFLAYKLMLYQNFPFGGVTKGRINLCSRFCATHFVLYAVLLKDGSLPFARSIKDIHSEFRFLSKLTELLMNHGEKEEALQYATLAVQVAGKTGTCRSGLQESPCYLTVVTVNAEVNACFFPQECR